MISLLITLLLRKLRHTIPQFGQSRVRDPFESTGDAPNKAPVLVSRVGVSSGTSTLRWAGLKMSTTSNRSLWHPFRIRRCSATQQLRLFLKSDPRCVISRRYTVRRKDTVSKPRDRALEKQAVELMLAVSGIAAFGRALRHERIHRVLKDTLGRKGEVHARIR